MDKYKIEFGQWEDRPNTHDVSEFAILYVCTGGVALPLSIQMSGTLEAMLPSMSKNQKRQRMLRVALPRLISKLNSMEAPKVSTSTFILTESFSSNDLELFKIDLGLTKQCLFKEKNLNGLFCHAAADADTLNGKTSSAVCAACDLPDDVLRCANMTHPEVISLCSDAGCHGKRVISYFCDIKTAASDHTKCVPGGNACWLQEINNMPQTPEIAGDIAERMIDELQYMNLSFHKAFNCSLLRLNDPRTIANIFTPCDSQEEFTTKVACLTDLLNNLDLSSIKDEIPADVKGTINRLEYFLKLKAVLLDEKPIKTLRKIISLRNSFPIHSGSAAFLKVCEELGVKYPPDSWKKAWDIIIYNAWRSFRSLRTMLP